MHLVRYKAPTKYTKNTTENENSCVQQEVGSLALGCFRGIVPLTTVNLSVGTNSAGKSAKRSGEQRVIGAPVSCTWGAYDPGSLS
ncbi:hypothetical protein GOBAR_DD32880 [Gossypium barbadense]|nr:hypothetical protein GOBAR_DD32880 [Gossypium barbadense]